MGIYYGTVLLMKFLDQSDIIYMYDNMEIYKLNYKKSTKLKKGLCI